MEKSCTTCSCPNWRTASSVCGDRSPSAVSTTRGSPGLLARSEHANACDGGSPDQHRKITSPVGCETTITILTAAYLRQSEVLVSAQQGDDGVAPWDATRRQAAGPMAAARRGVQRFRPPAVIGPDVQVQAEVDAAGEPGEASVRRGAGRQRQRHSGQQHKAQRDQPPVPAAVERTISVRSVQCQSGTCIERGCTSVQRPIYILAHRRVHVSQHEQAATVMEHTESYRPQKSLRGSWGGAQGSC